MARRPATAVSAAEGARRAICKESVVSCQWRVYQQSREIAALDCIGSTTTFARCAVHKLHGCQATYSKGAARIGVLQVPWPIGTKAGLLLQHVWRRAYVTNLNLRPMFCSPEFCVRGQEWRLRACTALPST